MKIEVRAGQIWEDKAPKKKGRTVKIVRIDDDAAHCVLITKVGGDPAAAGPIIRIPVADFEDQYEILDDPTGEPPTVATENADDDELPQPPLVREIGEWVDKNPIITWLAENNTTQVALAGLIGVSRIALQNWINGRTPNEQNLNRLAAAMGIQTEELDGKWDLWLALKPSP